MYSIYIYTYMRHRYSVCAPTEDLSATGVQEIAASVFKVASQHPIKLPKNIGNIVIINYIYIYVYI